MFEENTKLLMNVYNEGQRDSVYRERYDGIINELTQLFPEIYSNVTCGMYIPVGWLLLVKELSDKIVELENIHNCKIGVDQVKEKFGGLRYHIHFKTKDAPKETIDIFYNLINEYETKSSGTCMTCGEPGKVISKGWISVKCEKHK